MFCVMVVQVWFGCGLCRSFMLVAGTGSEVVSGSVSISNMLLQLSVKKGGRVVMVTVRCSSWW